MKTLYLHVGLHKTATSSIQKTLFDNREKLKESGYLYPSCWDENHSKELYSMFCDEPETYHINIRNNRFEKKLEEYNLSNRKNIIEEVRHSAANKIIFSGEDISILNEENLYKLKQFINEELFIEKIIVIVFVRSLLSFTSSDVQEIVKNGKHVKYSDILTPVRKNLYFSRLNKLLTVFKKENVFAYSFEDACQETQGPVSFFMKTIEISQDVINSIEIAKSNESISDSAFDIINFINYNYPFIKDGQVNPQRSSGDIKPLMKLKGNKYHLPVKVQSYLLKHSQNDLQWLNENFHINYLNTTLVDTQEIQFDQAYINTIKTIFPNLSTLMQGLVLNYIQYRFAANKNKQLQELIEYLKNNFDIIELNTKKPEEESIENLELLRLRKIIKESKNVQDADIFREIALYAEDCARIDIAVFFMQKAKDLRPKGPIINAKLEEYINLLKVNNDND